MAKAPRKRRKNRRFKKGLKSYEPHWPIHGLSRDNCVIFCVLARPHGARIAVSQRAPGIHVLRGGYGTLQPSRNAELLYKDILWYGILFL